MRISIIGNGAFGSAFSTRLTHLHHVSMWGRGDDIATALKDADLVLLAIPVQSLRGVLADMRGYIPEDAVVVNTAKGIESTTCNLPSEIISDVFGETRASRVCYFSGPTFAADLAAALPIAATVACHDGEIARRAIELLAMDKVRLYHHHDVIGVQLGGALKNVVAIAAGICDGLGLGHSARASLMTRGLYEMVGLATKKGAEERTLMGLSGLGDLILTCTGDLSRNRRVGLGLASGKTLVQVIKEIGQVAEGIETTRALKQLSDGLEVEMPIVHGVYNILFGCADPRRVIDELFSRGHRSEF